MILYLLYSLMLVYYYLNFLQTYLLKGNIKKQSFALFKYEKYELLKKDSTHPIICDMTIFIR